jgi:arginine/lysine/ornithine decarboxylase
MVGQFGAAAVDPLRLVVGVSGLSVPGGGYGVATLLEQNYAVAVELSLPKCIACVITGGNMEDDVAALVEGLAHIAQRFVRTFLGTKSTRCRTKANVGNESERVK